MKNNPLAPCPSKYVLATMQEYNKIYLQFTCFLYMIPSIWVSDEMFLRTFNLTGNERGNNHVTNQKKVSQI